MTAVVTRTGSRPGNSEAAAGLLCGRPPDRRVDRRAESGSSRVHRRPAGMVSHSLVRAPAGTLP